MKQTILGTDERQYIRKLYGMKGIFGAVIALALGLNVILTLSRTDANQKWILLANIIIDVLTAWGVFYCYCCVYRPRKELLVLYSSKTEELSGEILAIGAEPRWIGAFPCLPVTMGAELPRLLFVPADTVSLAVGSLVTVRIADNMITEVETA